MVSKNNSKSLGAFMGSEKKPSGEVRELPRAARVGSPTRNGGALLQLAASKSPLTLAFVHSLAFVQEHAED